MTNPTKIYITGDIHGDPFHRFSSKNFLEGKKLSKNDFVIIVGDFGIIWEGKSNKDELYKLEWLDNKPWTTLFLDGNHENFFRLNEFPVEHRFGGTVGIISESVYHLKRGEIYTLGNKTFFCFGGALSWDKEHRITGISHWNEEIPNFKEMDKGIANLQECQYEVDYVLSHTFPTRLRAALSIAEDKNSEQDPTCKYLEHIAQITTFKKWFFGHMHINVNFGKYECLYERIKIIEGINGAEQ